MTVAITLLAIPVTHRVTADPIPTSVQRFTQSMGSSAQIDVALTTAVDPDHSFIIAEARSSSNTTASSIKVGASFINGGADVRLDRVGTATGVTVQLQVVTMPSITVEHGTIGTASLGTGVSSFNQTITDVGNVNTAFAVITNFGTGTAANYMRQQWAASLTSTTNLNVARGVTGNTSTVNYQIVKFVDGTTVEHDTISIAAASSSGTAAISAVTIADSFLWGSWRSDSARTDVSPSWEFDSTTQVSATRAGTTGTTTVELMTVALPTSAITQQSSVADVSTTSNATITAVADTAKTFTFISNRHSGTSTTFDQMNTTTLLSSTTNVQARVGDATGTAVGRVQTVELPIFIIPDDPVLYNDDGGSNQIAFNNIRQNSTTPTFRASATNSTSFDRFQLELNTAADFGGTSYTQTFSSTYSSGTEYNLDASSLSPSLPTTDGVTYYVRVRASADSGVLWSGWSAGPWTYTYKSASEDPDWFQTTDEQFVAGTLTDTQTSGGDSVGLAAGAIVERAGSASSFVNSVNASSTGITVPPDAEIMVVGASGHDAGGTYWNNGVVSISGFGNFTKGPQETTFGNSMGGLWYLDISPLADTDQTLAWDWDGTGSPGDAGTYFTYAFYKGVDTSSPVGASDSNNSAGPSVSTSTLTLNEGDAIVAMGTKQTGSGAWTNATETTAVSDGTGASAMAEAFPSANTSVTYTGSNSMVAAIVLNQNSATASSGTILSPPIAYDSFDGASSWDAFDWSEDETNGSVSVQLYYTDSTTCDTIVPDGALSGNSTGFTSGPVDISGLNTSTYDEICIRASLTDSGGSPFLEDWTVTWAAVSNTAPDAPTSLVQRKIDDTALATGDWTNETSVEFTASATDTDNPENLQLCIEVDELGTGFSNTEDSCGSAVAYSGSAVTVTHTISSLSDGTEYHWQARIKDDDNAYSSWVSYPTPTPNSESARDFGVDTTDPSTGSVYDTDGIAHTTDVDFNDGSLSALNGGWDGFSDTSGGTPSGIAKYEYSIGTTQGGTDIKTWTDNSLTTNSQDTSLTLQTSQIYYYNVRATDNAGNVSSVVSSDGQMILPDLSFSILSTSISFDELDSGNNWTDTDINTLSTTTNAFGGYVIRSYLTDFLTSGSYTIGDFTGGTYASPNTWQGSDTGFGYTSEDVTIQGASKFPTSGPCPGGRTASGADPCYAPFSQTAPGDIVADNTGPVTGSSISDDFDFTTKVAVTASQAALPYNTTLIFIATPSY